MAYQLKRYNAAMYKRICRADEDFVNAGEQPYFRFNSYGDYISWLVMLSENRKGRMLPAGWAPYELLTLTDESGELLCLGQLRYGNDNGNMTWAGHIGYSVPPSKRRHGYATAFLKLCLDYAWDAGFEHVMLTCDVTNIASKAVIERCGGAFTGRYTDQRYDKYQYMFFRPENRGKPI